MSRQRPMKTVDGQELFRCSRCKLFLHRDSFYSDQRTKQGIKSECKTCHCATSVRTRSLELHRLSNKEHMRRARKLEPEKFRNRERIFSASRPRDSKWNARRLLNLALSRGELIRSPVCERCRVAAKTQAHHSDYGLPLTVEWLCSECHGIVHRKASHA